MIKKKEKGFTLIELLAVIAIISIITSIVTYLSISTIKNSKEKTNDISSEAIYKSSALYANETYHNSNYWIDPSEKINYEYACVPIKELVNKGYLKENDIENLTDDYIQVIRDKDSKTITKEIIDKSNICGGTSTKDYRIDISLIKVTTSSISYSAICQQNNSILKNVNYNFELFDENGNILESKTIKNNQYTFDNLKPQKTYKYSAKCILENKKEIAVHPDDIKSRTTGATDITFSTSDLKIDSEEQIYKSVTINFTGKNIYPEEIKEYYFKTTSKKVISDTEVYKCGNKASPNNCSSTQTTKLEKGYWYKTTKEKIKLNMYENSIIYAKVWDGAKYSTNKSIQMTFPTNPYVVINITQKGYEEKSGGYIGESNDNLLEYHTDKWLNNPTITWKVYGGYEVESNIYYSDENTQTRNNYSTKNIFKDKINSNLQKNSTTGKLENIKINGQEEIALEVKNKQTKKKTIIKVHINIDNLSPTLSVTSSNNTTYTKTKTATVTLTDNGGSGLEATSNKIYYAWENSNVNCSSMTSFITITPTKGATQATGTITIKDESGAGKLYVCNKETLIKDTAGNTIEQSTIKSTDMYLDNIGPIITFESDGNSSYAKNISSKITVTNDGPSADLDPSTYKYIWSTNTSNTPNTTFTNETNLTKKDETGKYYLIAKACDKLGNCTTKVSKAFYLDNTAPSIPTINNPTNGNWTNSNFSLTVSSSDNHSGISYYQYKYTNSNWTTYSNSASNSFTTTQFSTERNEDVYIRACDKAGNCSESNSTKIRIDKTAPTINIYIKNSAGTTINSAANYQKSGSIYYNNGNWSNSIPTIYFSITDDLSTTNNVYYNPAEVYGSNYEEAKSLHTFNANDRSEKSGSISVNSGGKRKLKFVITDQAGNQTIVDVYASLDYVKPSAPTSVKISGNNLVLSGSSDNESGLKNDRISFYGPVDKHYYTSTIALSDFTTTGSYWFGTSSDDKAGNNGNSNAITGTLVVSNTLTNSWYECSSGYVSGSYCYHYGTVRTSSYTYTCTKTCSCSGTTASALECWYNTTESGCTGRGYTWTKYGCYNPYATYSCSSTCTGYENYCDSGYSYYNGTCYYTTAATYKTKKYCDTGYTQVNDLCYKIS